MSRGFAFGVLCQAFLALNNLMLYCNYDTYVCAMFIGYQ